MILSHFYKKGCATVVQPFPKIVFIDNVINYFLYVTETFYRLVHLIKAPQ
nr:MAG TPA: hypothetical protein [Caudoviricetes sp.]